MLKELLKDVENLEPLHTASGDGKQCSRCGEQDGGSLKE